MNKENLLHKQNQLLQDYITTLEKQLLSKTNQVGIIRSQIIDLKEQNQMLKQFIEVMRDKQMNPTKVIYFSNENDNQNVKDSKNIASFSTGEDVYVLKQLLEQIKCDVDRKEGELNLLREENQLLKNKVLKQEQEMNKIMGTINLSEEKIGKQFQQIKLLQEQNKLLQKCKSQGKINNKLEQKKCFSFAQLEAQKFIKQKKQLTEKLKNIQKSSSPLHRQCYRSPLRQKLKFPIENGRKITQIRQTQQKINQIQKQNNLVKVNSYIH